MKAPLVTVYITNYNYGRFVRQAIDSVLQQTFSDFELIIIDDGSTDSSREILLEYEEHPKVRIIFQTNRGLNVSNNIALKASNGYYIIRLDADDYFDENALLVMVSHMEKDKSLGLIFPDYYYVDVNGRLLGQERRHDFREGVSLLDQPAHGACTLVRKSCLISVGGYSEQYRCQDGYDLWLRFIERHKVANVRLPLFYYRKHGSSLTNNNSLIIETRARIKESHADQTEKPKIGVHAIIPVRGRKVFSDCIALETLGNRRVIDWTIDAALGSKNIDTVVVTSPDQEVLSHTARKYLDAVIVEKRPVEMARENTPITSTISYIFKKRTVTLPDAIMILTPDAPFRSDVYIDKSINTMRIFDVDSVIGIIPETDLLFKHNGNGLELLGNNHQTNSLRFEREYIYRHLPGTTLVKIELFKNENKCIGGKIGHVIYDTSAARIVRSREDLYFANCLIHNKMISRMMKDLRRNDI
jgi:glycosyltransferase involved in cell wall biosynthesis